MNSKNSKGGGRGGARGGGSSKPTQTTVGGLDPAALEQAQKATLADNPELHRAVRLEIFELKKKIDDEDRLKNFYNLEKEKVNNLWIISKKELEDEEANLKNKERESKDLEENHTMTKNLYKQKIKHILFQNQDKHGEMRIQEEKKLQEMEDQNRIIAQDLDSDNRDLKKKLKEQELSQNTYLFSLQFDTNQQFTNQRQEHERAIRELTLKYDLKKKKVYNEMEDLRNTMVKKLEDEKDKIIKKHKSDQTEDYKNIKNYYNDITTSNLSLIKQFKEDIQKAQDNEEKERQTLKKLQEQNLKLRKPLEEARKDIIKLKEDEKEWIQIKQDKNNLNKAISRIEEEYKQLEYEYEVRLQQFNYLEQEKDSLFEKYEDVMYDIHQKSGLRNLILEKKKALIKERLEAKECELSKVLSISNIDEENRRQIADNLQVVLAMKDQLIGELQEDLRQIRAAHVHMVKAYDGKLSEFGIPVEELGFNPLVPTNVDVN
jgi:growth arrest-specific protein 8